MRLNRGIFVMALAIWLAPVASWEAEGASHPVKGQEKKAEKPAAPAARRHVGTVKAVDPAAGSLTVTEKEGGAEVSVTEKTAIKRGKESLKLVDLKPGDAVSVVYVKQDGKDVARSVTVTSK
jgi:Cu/Ag efflux protein CusF